MANLFTQSIGCRIRNFGGSFINVNRKNRFIVRKKFQKHAGEQSNKREENNHPKNVKQGMKEGQSLARRVLGTTTRANVIGKIESLLIAEAPAMRTSLVGQTLLQSKLRKTIGINVVGVWERGRFIIPTVQTLINPTTVLLLAGSADQLSEYDKKFGRDKKYQAPVLILGGGRVGQAAGDALMERNIDYRIIEKNKNLSKMSAISTVVPLISTYLCGPGLKRPLRLSLPPMTIQRTFT